MRDRCWTVHCNADDTGEIMIYGPIVSDNGPLEHNTTAEKFAADLKTLGGHDITVRINSCGGDIFAAHAIHSLLRDYAGSVTVVVDGLAASAASVIAMAGDRVVMPANALMMIHDPAIDTNGYMTEADLQAMSEMLAKVKESIVAAYMRRAKVSETKVRHMMSDETWLSAAECVELGLADEISGTADIQMRGQILVVNNAKYHVNAFKNPDALKKHIETPKEVKAVTKLEEILNKLGLLDEAPAPQPVAETPVQPAKEVDASEIVAAERKRVADLAALKCDSIAVNAVIETAKDSGASVDDVRAYIDAIRKAESAIAEPHAQMVQDSKDSGVDNIEAAPATDKSADAHAEEEKALNFMASILSKKFKGGKH